MRLRKRDDEPNKGGTDAFGAPTQPGPEPDVSLDSAVPSLRGRQISDLAEHMRTLRSAPRTAPDLGPDAGAGVRRTNPRVARALDDDELSEAEMAAEIAELPDLPDPITEDAAYNWVREVIPGMDPKLRYTRRLVRMVQRYDFDQSKLLLTKDTE